MNVKVTGAKEFVTKLSKTSKNIQNMKPAYKKAVVLYHQWIQKNFQANGKLHENSKFHWGTLADSTVRWKNRTGRDPSTILVQTGNLRRDWDLTSTSQYGLIRSGHYYSKFHEEGIGVPQRKIFPEESQAMKFIQPVFRGHIFRDLGIK